VFDLLPFFVPSFLITMKILATPPPKKNKEEKEEKKRHFYGMVP
jgi:hypothetical protein